MKIDLFYFIFMTMRKTFKIVKRLSAGLSWRMFRGLLSKPLLLLPTIWATVESVMYSEINFKEPHGGQGIANAFRHAAWNLLIAKNCTQITSQEKAIDWAKYVTDLHEECFPNDDFDKLMDLHNNRIGREVFEKLMDENIQSKKEMIRYLVEKTKTGVGLSDEKEFKNHKDEMVYLDK